MDRFAIAVLAVLALAGAAQAQLAAIDVSVLNFALNLEYLEANFYSCAAYGKPIDQSLWGVGGVAPTGCQKANLTQWGYEVADEIAKDEIAHVALLRTVLGARAVAQPLMNIGTAFRDAANAAASLALGSNVTLSPPFNPYANEVFFFHGAFIFEDVGATAYAGAAALIEDKAYLTAAAQILAAESYHSGAVRFQLARLQNRVAPFTAGLRIRQVVEAISGLRDAVDGASDIDQGITVEVSSEKGKKRQVWNLFPTDANGLIYTRNTDQVLRIVYLGGASRGGFFPNGLNGDIKVASS